MFFRLTIAAALILWASSLRDAVFAQCQPETDCKDTETNYSLEEAKCPRQETDPERYVLGEVLSGKAVAFHVKRELSGCFMKDLLVGSKGKIPQFGIKIDNAVFVGPIDIRNAEISNRVELTNCTFTGDFNMKRSHFARGLSLAGSSFGSEFDGPGRLDTEFAIIDSDFIIDGCTFNNCFAYFAGTHVAGDWSLRHAVFVGAANFTGTITRGNFFADDAEHPTEFHRNADFEFMKVELDAGLSFVVFDGFANFSNAEFKNFSIKDTLFKDCVNFRSSEMNNFYLAGKEKDLSRQFRNRVTIEDMTFQYMSPEDWDVLKSFAEISNAASDQRQYSAQLYTSLEAQFRKHGRPDKADEIYIAGMRKERRYLSWFGKMWSYFQDGFIGYGRDLKRLLYLWSPLFLLAGYIVFRSESNMETKRLDDAPRYAGKYKPFWYTVDLFLPIIRLGEAEIWNPKQRWRSWYKYCHIIVGNLFVPIGLAAWTGIIK